MAMKQRNGGSDTNGDDQRHLAVLIDADNAQASVIGGLLAEVAKYGVANVKRIYGDFTSQRLASWKNVLLDHSIQPMQQFAYTSGKNATDSSLIIDAMDLMYTGRFHGMCLVTSDSDFTRLAQRLREEGLTVYGFGEKKTPDAFVQACDKFIYVEVLRKPEAAKASGSPAGSAPVRGTARKATKAATKQAPPAAAKPPAPTGRTGAQPVPASTKAAAVGDIATAKGVAAAPPPRSLTEVTVVDAPALDASQREPLPRALLAQAIDAASDEQGWAQLGNVGSYVSKVRPDFDTRLYGHRKLSDLVRAHPGIFEVQERGEGSSKAVFVRTKE